MSAFGPWCSTRLARQASPLSRACLELRRRPWIVSSPTARRTRSAHAIFRRWRRWFAIEVVIEAVIAVAGLIAGVWMFVRGGSFLVVSGIATFVLVAATCALSAWARSAHAPRPDDPVPTRRRRGEAARVRACAARSSHDLGGSPAGMVFTAVMALARGLLTANPTLSGYVAIGAVQLMLAVWLAFAFLYYQGCSADLAKLDAIADSLHALTRPDPTR